MTLAALSREYTPVIDWGISPAAFIVRLYPTRRPPYPSERGLAT